MTGEQATNRQVLAIEGADRSKFLQGLVTNDAENMAGQMVYAALLSPQGKYLADFFLTEVGEAILLDVKSDLAPALAQRLQMYKLRADVTITPSSLHVLRGLSDAPAGAFDDPRHPALGWRMYTAADGDPPSIDWQAIRVAHCIPESGIELVPNESYILESGFEGLSGVDFKKGCYVGQEVTARMKHKTELRKGLATVSVTGSAPIGTEITSGDKVVGHLFSQANGQGIAYLRFDRATGEMTARGATVRWQEK